MSTCTSTNTEKALQHTRSSLVPSVQHCNTLTWEAAWFADPAEPPLIPRTTLLRAARWRKGFLEALSSLNYPLTVPGHCCDSSCSFTGTKCSLPAGSSTGGIWVSQSPFYHPHGEQPLSLLQLCKHVDVTIRAYSSWSCKKWYRKVRARFCKSLPRERSLSDS